MYINMNGDSKKEIFQQWETVTTALKNALDAVHCATALAHGRNAIDPEDADKMRNQKNENTKALFYMLEQYLNEAEKHYEFFETLDTHKEIRDIYFKIAKNRP